MSWPLTAALVWIIAANLIAMLPSRDHHWRAAYALVAIGVPMLGWLTVVHGPTLGLLFLAAAASVLRWPVWFLWLWLTGRGRD
jgi:hypothetical protein